MSITESYAEKSIDYDDFFHCTKEYQNYVVRILSIQAFAEKAGACEMAAQLKHAPNAKARMGLAKIIYDEANHAFLLYSILEKIGVNEKEAIAIASTKNSRGHETQSLQGVLAVADEKNEWLDIILNNMFMDRAGSHMVGNFAKSSFKPWAEACQKIYTDEQWHKAFGLMQLKHYLTQQSINQAIEEKIKKWYLYALNFFGPPNVKSQAALKHYGIKRLSNEVLRAEFKQEVELALTEINLAHLVQGTLSAEYPYVMNQSGSGTDGTGNIGA